MLGKVRIMAIAAATLLASPAFAGWPAGLRQSAAASSKLDRWQRRSRSSASTLILR